VTAVAVAIPALSASAHSASRARGNDHGAGGRRDLNSSSPPRRPPRPADREPSTGRGDGTIQPNVRTVALVTLFAAVLLAAPASAGTLLLGRSWQGRAIEAVEVGNAAGTPVLVVGCIHGNETGGIAIAHALERLSPTDLDLWIVPDLNPDGGT
jgi:hypothetical protein